MNSFNRNTLLLAACFAVVVAGYLFGPALSGSSPAWADTTVASPPRTLDDLMGNMQKRMDSFMNTPFFSDPSLDNLRGFELFDKSLTDRFERMFQGMSLPGHSTKGLPFSGELKSDVRQENGNLIMTIDLPGHEKNSMDVRVKDNSLIISSERRSQGSSSDDKNKVFRNEISYGKMSRVIGFPKKVVEDKVTARYENGVLTVVAPIDTQAPPDDSGRKLDIQ